MPPEPTDAEVVAALEAALFATGDRDARELKTLPPLADVQQLAVHELVGTLTADAYIVSQRLLDAERAGWFGDLVHEAAHAAARRLRPPSDGENRPFLADYARMAASLYRSWGALTFTRRVETWAFAPPTGFAGC